jgi:hypothetical protein
MNAPRVWYSWRTSACVMNIVRHSAGSIRAYATLRSFTIGRPYSVTCSRAMTCPCFCSQCGSPWLRRHSAPAALSSHAGSMRATHRANSCDVSTSSAAITHGAGLRASPDDGWIAKRVCRAPMYTRASGLHMPILLSSPGTSARWSCSPEAGALPGANRSSRITCTSWSWMSSHSRIRLYDRKLSRQSFCSCRRELRARASCQKLHSLR